MTSVYVIGNGEVFLTYHEYVRYITAHGLKNEYI